MTTCEFSTISGVEKRMKRWAKKNKWKMFLYTGSVDDDVATSTSDIDRIVETLQASPYEIP